MEGPRALFLARGAANGPALLTVPRLHDRTVSSSYHNDGSDTYIHSRRNRSFPYIIHVKFRQLSATNHRTSDTQIGSLAVARRPLH